MSTIEEHHEICNMCFTHCYAGRTGGCATAGQDNQHTRDCLYQYRKERGGAGMINPCCHTCRKLKRGNLHHPEGRIEYGVTVCIDRRCEPGLNTFYRPVVTL